MKKIYQIGFIASLVALLPTGMLFAGNGDGDGKNTINISGVSSTDRIRLVVHTEESVNNNDNIVITSRTDYSEIASINPITGGFEVFIDVHSTQSASNGDDEVIIIEIVGVDNITGVDATDGNNGNSVPTNLVADDSDNKVATSPSTNTNTSTGLHASPEANTNGTGGINSNPLFSSNHKEDITIYPNPVRSETNVVTVGEILGKEIEIIDLSGNVVLNMVVPANSRQTQLNLSSLNPGLYILSYKMEDGRVISKRIQKI